MPALACGVALLIAWRPWRPGGALAGGRWGSALGLGACFLIAFVAAERWPPLPPLENWHWLAYLAIAATLWGGVEASGRLPAGVLAGRLVLAVLAGWLITGSWVDHHWSWRFICAGCIIVLAEGMGELAPRARGSAVALSLCLGAAGAGALLVLAQQARFGQLAGALAGGLAIAVALSWWRPQITLAPGGIVVYAVLVCGLLYSGFYVSYSEVPSWAYMVAALAPLAAWVGEWGPVARLRPWGRTGVRAAAVVVVLAGVLGTAWVMTSGGEALP